MTQNSTFYTTSVILIFSPIIGEKVGSRFASGSDNFTGDNRTRFPRDPSPPKDSFLTDSSAEWAQDDILVFEI